MSIDNEARYRAKSLLLKYRISKLTLNNIVYILEQQGFEIVEYGQNVQQDSSWSIIETLGLSQYALSGKAFAYQLGKTKLIFVCEDLTADEKLYALAHEEGHILCGHLHNGVSDINLVEQEHIANEIAHYLINPPILLKLWLKMLDRKKLTISIIAVVWCVAIITFVAVLIMKETSYYGEYYITESGTKYHEENCLIIKDKNNVRRLTEKDYYSGEYDPCQVCLPD